MSLLKGTIKGVLTLEADYTNNLTRYIALALEVHANMKIHTGSVFTMGKEEIISCSTTQKVNSQSSTESELIDVYNKIAKVLWMNRFMEYQVFSVKLNIIYQDNTRSINLEENSK